MMSDNDRNSGQEWLRLLFMLLFFVVLFYVMKLIVTVIFIVQFLFRIITGESNERLTGFSTGLSRYGHEVLEYVTYASDRRPFPFSDWPGRQRPVTASPGEPGSRDDTD